MSYMFQDIITKYKHDLYEIFSNHAIVYHYTNIDVVYGVLKKQKFWLTKCDYLNDITEIKYSLDLIEKKMKDICNNIEEIERLRLIKRIKYIVNHTYSMSFSSNKDSLTLWGNYSKFEGYNIGINSSEISWCEVKKKIYVTGNHEDTNNQPIKYYNGDGCIIHTSMAPVVYNSEKQLEVIMELLKGLDNFYSVLAPSERTNKEFSLIETEFVSNLAYYCGFFKKDSFSHEEEYRLLINLNERCESEVIKFRKSNGVFIPYIEIGFDLDESTSIIKLVGIGPKNKMDLAVKGLSSYLEHLKYNIVHEHELDYSGPNKKIAIIESNIPLRY